MEKKQRSSSLRSSSSLSSRPRKKARVLEIEACCDRRIDPNNHEKQFLIKWKGHPELENSWEPIANIDDQGRRIGGGKKNLCA